MNDDNGEVMSRKSILRAALLLLTIAALAVSIAQVTASWDSGSQVGASWVSRMYDAPAADTPE